MADEFAELIDRSIAFFAELEANNTKAWFEEKKAAYTADIKKPAELLAEILRDEIVRMTDVSVKEKLFRIHRDVRFSKDKTPYNAHLHLMWSPLKEGGPVWFFGAAPSYLVTGMGAMGFQGARMTQYRAMVDRDGDRLASALAETKEGVGATLSDWGPEPLKRVPKPFDPDHPHGDLLRRKSLTISAPLAGEWRSEGLIPAVMAGMRGMLPVWRILDSTFG